MCGCKFVTQKQNDFLTMVYVFIGVQKDSPLNNCVAVNSLHKIIITS